MCNKYKLIKFKNAASVSSLFFINIQYVYTYRAETRASIYLPPKPLLYKLLTAASDAFRVKMFIVHVMCYVISERNCLPTVVPNSIKKRKVGRGDC